jgi:ribosome-associated translation inhibitor RaiA
MMAQISSRERFPTQVPRPIKRTAGATGVSLTPLNVRAGKRVTLDDATLAHVQRRMARQLGKLAVLVERSTVRFDDINGKRGGVDVRCSINVVLTGRPSVVVEERAAAVRAAFDAAAATAERAVRRAVGRAEMSARPSRSQSRGEKAQRDAVPPNLPPAEGSLIGRRVGKARANLEAAVARPEKQRRDSVVDTAQPGVSATDRKAGGGSTARRNAKRNVAGLTSALEDSAQATPSRKSTRGSAGRAKRDGNLKLRQTRALHSAKERARRNIVKQS